MSNWVINKQPFGISQELFRQGQPPRDAYLIERGRVEISRLQGDTKVVLGHREVGEIVGEMALIDGAPRTATATAMEPTVCVVISQKLFQEHLQRATPLLRSILTTFTKNMRSMTDRATG